MHACNNNALRVVLKEKEISNVDLAKLLGISKRQVFNYLSGHSTPTSKRALLLSQLTDLPLEVILGLSRY